MSHFWEQQEFQNQVWEILLTIWLAEHFSRLYIDRTEANWGHTTHKNELFASFYLSDI